MIFRFNEARARLISIFFFARISSTVFGTGTNTYTRRWIFLVTSFGLGAARSNRIVALSLSSSKRRQWSEWKTVKCSTMCGRARACTNANIQYMHSSGGVVCVVVTDGRTRVKQKLTSLKFKYIHIGVPVAACSTHFWSALYRVDASYTTTTCQRGRLSMDGCMDLDSHRGIFLIFVAS